ncbi:MAG: HD domain-containing phosphohydrolase [bacterium]
MNGKPVEQQPQDEAPAWEEFTIAELAKKLEREDVVYYALDPIRDRRTKRKLVDPRGILTPSILRGLHTNWDVSEDAVIRVTTRLDLFDKEEELERNATFYANQIYHFLMRIFKEEKKSYKAELQGLAVTCAEMLDKLFSYDRIEETLLHPSELRAHNTYHDHLVNTAVYWTATFAALNKKRTDSPGAVEVWRSRSKPELRDLGVTPDREKSLVLYYDIYGRDRAAADVAEKKKSDMSLVLSGFFGALFHDVALIEQPRIIPPAGKDVPPLLLAHPDKTNELLKQRLPALFDDRPLVRSIIKKHHERLDGSGYPDRKKDPHLFARIVAVCDTFDELASCLSKGHAVHHIALGAGRRFDGEVVRAFLSCVKPYDEGEVLPVYEENGREPVMEAKVVRLQNRFRPCLLVQSASDERFASRVGGVLDLADPDNRDFVV